MVGRRDFVKGLLVTLGATSIKGLEALADQPVTKDVTEADAEIKDLKMIRAYLNERLDHLEHTVLMENLPEAEELVQLLAKEPDVTIVGGVTRDTIWDAMKYGPNEISYVVISREVLCGMLPWVRHDYKIDFPHQDMTAWRMCGCNWYCPPRRLEHTRMVIVGKPEQPRGEGQTSVCIQFE